MASTTVNEKKDMSETIQGTLKFKEETKSR